MTLREELQHSADLGDAATHTPSGPRQAAYHAAIAALKRPYEWEMIHGRVTHLDPRRRRRAGVRSLPQRRVHAWAGARGVQVSGVVAEAEGVVTGRCHHGLLSMSAVEYHADPCDTPSLSASIAHVLDSQSPMHAYTMHPRLGGVARPPTKAFDLGSLSHALLLGNGKDIAIIDAPDYRTKAAQAARDQARDDGKVPVLVTAHEEAVEVTDTLRQRFADLGLVLNGKSEVAAFWTENTYDGTPVQCRGMMDHLKAPVVYDLKSCRSAHLDSCRKHVDAYGYDIQRAAYVSAMETLHPEFAGRIDFVFIFYELSPPFAVTPVRLSGAFRDLGRRRWKRAVNTWAQCLGANRWPAYVDSITELEPPKWAMSNDMERQFDTVGWSSEDHIAAE